MGSFLGKLFVDVDSLPDDPYGFFQVLFLGACYLYILLHGANMIGDGSELLMLIPSLAGVVGSVILPVLGAVPDGAIVLFSGLGPDAESQVSVGVGALAGSTVMLLTVPWFLSIIGGRVPLGLVNDRQGGGSRTQALYSKKSADVPIGCTSTGVGPSASIRKSAVVMMITCLPCYLVVEIPALIFINESKTTQAADVAPFAWAGAIICALMFVGYVAYQYRLANAGSHETTSTESLAPLLEQRINDVMIKAIQKGRMGLRGLLMDSMPIGEAANSEGLLSSQGQEEAKAKLRRIVRPFFLKFDSDGNGSLSRVEMTNLVKTLGENVTPAEIDHLFTTADIDGDGKIDFNEFLAWISQLVQKQQAPPMLRARTADARVLQMPTVGEIIPEGSASSLPGASVDVGEEEDDNEDDDEVEVPEDILELHLSPDQQRARVLRRAFWQMGVGTLVVLLFSDPAVDVLDSIGRRTNIDPFFVAFLLGPIASNASEMVASLQYSKRKTQNTISVAFAQLLGAACMNNTFCLLIFYLLIAVRGLTWTFHAEVIGIIFAELVMAVMASRHVHTVRDGVVVLTLLPATLVLVAILKGTVFQKVEG